MYRDRASLAKTVGLRFVRVIVHYLVVADLTREVSSTSGQAFEGHKIRWVIVRACTSATESASPTPSLPCIGAETIEGATSPASNEAVLADG